MVKGHGRATDHGQGVDVAVAVSKGAFIDRLCERKGDGAAVAKVEIPTVVAVLVAVPVSKVRDLAVNGDGLVVKGGGGCRCQS
jgi:hypothetical protein